MNILNKICNKYKTKIDLKTDVIVCDTEEKEKKFNKINKLIYKLWKTTKIYVWIDLEYGTINIELLHICYKIYDKKEEKKIIIIFTPKLLKLEKTLYYFIKKILWNNRIIKIIHGGEA